MRAVPPPMMVPRLMAKARLSCECIEEGNGDPIVGEGSGEAGVGDAVVGEDDDDAVSWEDEMVDGSTDGGETENWTEGEVDTGEFTEECSTGLYSIIIVMSGSNFKRTGRVYARKNKPIEQECRP